MGTVVSVDVRTADAGGLDEAFVARRLDAFFAELHRLERVLSPWLPDSEISRISDGRLAERDASPDVRFVLSACDHLASISDGAFDARAHRLDGRLDPSGFVKGWAVEEAAHLLDDGGLRHYAVNAGGDILVRGDAEPGSGAGWRVGIRDPDDGGRVVRTLRVRGLAVATSGRYERGDHIRDPRQSSMEAGPHVAARPTLASLTVVGPSLAWADAYATAGFVIGERALDWIERRSGFGGVAITTDRIVFWTPMVDRLLVPVDQGIGDFSRTSQPAAMS